MQFSISPNQHNTCGQSNNMQWAYYHLKCQRFWNLGMVQRSNRRNMAWRWNELYYTNIDEQYYLLCSGQYLWPKSNPNQYSYYSKSTADSDNHRPNISLFNLNRKC